MKKTVVLFASLLLVLFVLVGCNKKTSSKSTSSLSTSETSSTRTTTTSQQATQQTQQTQSTQRPSTNSSSSRTTRIPSSSSTTITSTVKPTVIPHECTSVCPVCGKCTNLDCDEEACSDKCPGHDLTKPIILSNNFLNKELAVSGSSVTGLSSYLVGADNGDALKLVATTYEAGADSLSTTNSWINPSEGNFYYIKTTDGYYLGLVNAENINLPTAWYVGKGVLDQDNLMYKWQFIEKSGYYLIKNVGGTLFSNNVWNNNAHVCADGDGHIQIYSYSDTDYFKFTVVNTVASFAEDKTIDLDDKTVNIANTLVNKYFKFDPQYDAIDKKYFTKGDDYTGLGSTNAGHVFTLEKVPASDFTGASLEEIPNAYRIKIGAKYLSYNNGGVFEERVLTSDLSSPWGTCQVFILKDVPGISNTYRLANMFAGQYIDSFDKQLHYRTFRAGGDCGDGIWYKEAVLQYDYNPENNWIIEEVEVTEHICNHVCPICGKCYDESCLECTDKCLGHLDLSKPVIISNRQLGKELAMVNCDVNGIDKCLAGADNGDALMFVPTTFTFSDDSMAHEYINPSNGGFYYIKTTDGYYLGMVNAENLGLSTAWYVGKGVLDSSNLMYLWQLIEEDGYYSLLNVGGHLFWKNPWPQSNLYACSDGTRIHLYDLGDNDYFMFDIRNTTAEFAQDKETDFDNKTVNIISSKANAFYKYDSTYIDGADRSLFAKGDDYTENSMTSSEYVFVLEKVQESEFNGTPVKNAYRIKCGTQYLSYVNGGNFILVDKANINDNIGQLFVLKDVPGLEDTYEISYLPYTFGDAADGQARNYTFCNSYGGVWYFDGTLAKDYLFDNHWMIKVVNIA